MNTGRSGIFALRDGGTDEARYGKDARAFADIVGESPVLRSVLTEAEFIAPIEIPVLITGASGTGKTQLAEAIHTRSPRRDRPFVEINCSAIPDTLIESEFFGASPGAYTGATRKLDGKVAFAQGGTLFLDEVAELSPR